MINPLLQSWKTPHGTPPFKTIKPEHFEAAIEESIKWASEEIARITESTEPATFENTIAALDRAGEKLGSISSILFNLNNAESSKELQAVAQAVSPLLTRFSNDITLNARLFKKVLSIYESRESLSLSTEEMMLLEKRYRNFILGGAGLDEKKRVRFREISEELAKICLKFEENVLEETNAFELHITDNADLAGIPGGLREAAAMEAKNRNKKGWIFTLHYPSYVPFMQYAENRELRKKMYIAFSSRAFHGNENDNRELVRRISNLRLELSNILGFTNYSEMALGDRMADSQEKVESFLNDLLKYSDPAALRDLNNVREHASLYGHNEEIQRWDWAYYSEKLKKSKYNIDDEILRPYFELESVRQAIFGLAKTLYGISFKETTVIEVYHPEVKTWEVLDSDNSFLALLYLDFFPRPGKAGGAWMTSFREQKVKDSVDIRPLVSVVTNFTRQTETTPSLLTFNELTTFLHEFGHALHAMLSRCTYEETSGTNVARDFVELPSQFMENWAFEQEWLDTWAIHYSTGEKIPQEIIKKIKEASAFNEGYASVRQLGFGFLDMAWHTIKEPVETDVAEFESRVMSGTDLFPPVRTANMSSSFTHLFGGGYAAGYYGYKWAEVLDADAFSYFREKGIFSKEAADSFRKNILERGASDKPLNLYVAFRGKEPSIDALLERSGLK